MVFTRRSGRYSPTPPTGGSPAVSRLTAPAPEETPAGAQRILDGIRKQFGFAPGMFNTLAANPAVLEIVMTLQDSISRLLDAKTRHTIALAVSHSNNCDYCRRCTRTYRRSSAACRQTTSSWRAQEAPPTLVAPPSLVSCSE